MPNKIKKTQIETPEVSQGRDSFETPNYATELLLPFIPKDVELIWECASGKGKIVKVLKEHGYNVFASTIWTEPFPENTVPFNFLTDWRTDMFRKKTVIVTNPPFSLKKKFYEQCLKYGIPFALLIPCDYSGWIIEALKLGCEKIIPERRIDYITPTGLSGKTGNTSNFHSMWLTYKFGLGKSETFVSLTNKMKEDV